MAGAHKTRGAFLADLAVDPPASTSDLAGPPHLDDDWLVLSTIHSAKGGEWQSVYVIHASDGNIPSDMALGEPGGVDEERRLLYVAMTRARDTLTITYPQRFYHRRGTAGTTRTRWAQPSRFLIGLERRDRRVVGRTTGHARRLRAASTARPKCRCACTTSGPRKTLGRVPANDPRRVIALEGRAELPRPRRLPDRRRLHHGVGSGVPRRLRVAC